MKQEQQPHPPLTHEALADVISPLLQTASAPRADGMDSRIEQVLHDTLATLGDCNAYLEAHRQQSGQ